MNRTELVGIAAVGAASAVLQERLRSQPLLAAGVAGGAVLLRPTPHRLRARSSSWRSSFSRSGWPSRRACGGPDLHRPQRPTAGRRASGSCYAVWRTTGPASATRFRAGYTRRWPATTQRAVIPQSFSLACPRPCRAVLALARGSGARAKPAPHVGAVRPPRADEPRHGQRDSVSASRDSRTDR